MKVRRDRTKEFSCLLIVRSASSLFPLEFPVCCSLAGPAGHSCGSATVEPALCPAGAYCPLGSASPTPCLKGTWSNKTGLHAANECIDCAFVRIEPEIAAFHRCPVRIVPSLALLDIQCQVRQVVHARLVRWHQGCVHLEPTQVACGTAVA
jgi:hypothetical protein